MIKIGICDDEKNICSSLETIIEEYMKNKNIQYGIDVFYSANSLLKYTDDGNLYDILFLDIEMEGLSGIEFGKILRDDMGNELTKIIYISWQNSHAIDLFQVRPFDFVVKPITKERLFKILEVVQRLIGSERSEFVYHAGNKYERIEIEAIYYFKSEAKKIIIHKNGKELTFYGKLDDVVKKIDGRYFWRIHKSYVINYMNTEIFDYKTVTMKNGEVLSISQKYRVDIRDKLDNI
ncbi:MAG: LytTR family DNA-binding domain-containing protein [Bacillota bacterium]|nr:LytTR family DNA-binding domain-containing protein [Bacillota bacterium]